MTDKKPDEKKDPWYPWFPRDHNADEFVQVMSLEAEGAYRRLLDHQWLHGSIPTDPKALAKICKGIAPAKLKKLWSEIAPLFHPAEGDQTRLQNRKVERVRLDAQERKANRKRAAEIAAAARWGESGRDAEAMRNASESQSQKMPTNSNTTGIGSPVPSSREPREGVSRETCAAHDADVLPFPRLEQTVTDGNLLARVRGELWAPDGLPPEYPGDDRPWTEGREMTVIRQLAELHGLEGVGRLIDGLKLLREGQNGHDGPVEWLIGQKCSLRVCYNAKAGATRICSQAFDAVYRDTAPPREGKRSLEAARADFKAGIQRLQAQAAAGSA